MRRRAFIELIGFLFTAFPKIPAAALYCYRGKQRQLQFFVSGSRFLDPVSSLKVGDRVEIRQGFFEGAPLLFYNCFRRAKTRVFTKTAYFSARQAALYRC